MIRRFIILDRANVEAEILINIDHIISIYVDDGKTWIELPDRCVISAIDYKYLADALCP